RLPLGVNVAPLVGHSALRLGVLGAAALERAATGEERAALAAAVRAAVAAGAIGWSTSRSPTHFFGDDGRPAPSRLADDEELLALAAALRDLDRGVIEVAPRTTIAGFDEKAEEQRFFAALARASGKVVSWAPLLDNPFAPGSAQRLLAEAAALQAAGAAVVPQVGCRPLELRFDFASATFGLDNNAFWRPIMAEPRAARARRFADPGFRAELRRFEGGFVAALAPGWDRLFVRLPATAEGRRYQDRSVAEIAAERGVPPLDAFCDLVLAEDLATQWGAVILNGDEEAVAALLRDPAGLLALSDAGAHVDTLSDQGFTTYLLGHWVRERGTLALEEAVRLLTDVPARRYGLIGRGRLAPGAAADLVLLDPTRVAGRPAPPDPARRGRGLRLRERDGRGGPRRSHRPRRGSRAARRSLKTHADRCRSQGADHPGGARALRHGPAHADGRQCERARCLRRPHLDHAEPDVQGRAARRGSRVH